MDMIFGYPSKEPCRVCGAHKNNQSEPRFGYTVCEDHQSVPPADIPNVPPKLQGPRVTSQVVKKPKEWES